MTETIRPFVHLRAHTDYTLGKGVSKATDFIATAAAHGQPALAITDEQNLYGAMGFSDYATKKGLQPIIGTRVHFKFGKDTRGGMTLLARNAEGYANICEIQRSCLDRNEGEAGSLIIPDSFALIEKHSAGIVAFAGTGPDSLFSALIRQPMSKSDCIEMVRYFAETFGPGNFFFEICRNGFFAPQETAIEKTGLQIALDAGIPLVATSDVWYSENSREQRDAFHLIDAIAGNRKASLGVGPDGVDVKDQVSHHLRTSEEMAALFADLPEAYENTLEIARLCAFKVEKRDPVLPPFVSPDGKSEAEQLREKSVAGLNARLAKAEKLYADRAEYDARLDTELTIIENMGFPGYFLIVADFINWSQDNDIPVGPGRGSGAGSLVAWSLGITGLDPLQFGLLFERFLNPDRVSMPDFDIDFCRDRRDEVITYVTEKYGSERVASIVTFTEIKAKGAIRDAARVIVPEEGAFSQMAINGIAELLPEEAAKAVTLDEAYEQIAVYKDKIDSGPQYRLLHQNAKLIEGIYKTSSKHAAGIVIGGRPLTELVPVGYDTVTGSAIVQYNMKHAESAGLVKFDFLGLKTLTFIKLILQFVRDTTGEDIDLDRIPFDDQPTMEMLSTGRTLGVFQFESNGMRRAMQSVKPTRIEDLIAIAALFRPGPMEMIPTFAACKNGEAEPDYPEPVEKTKPFLEETFGIMVYQEQVMKVAQEVAGYSLGGADLLRRAMGKKIKSEMDKQRVTFVEGAVSLGTSKEKASELFDKIAKFADYGFNKSHAAAYGLIAYHTAWLKRHYPSQFYAALMSFEKDKAPKLDAIRVEMAEMDINLLPPDINLSHNEFTPEASKSREGKYDIRFALTAIKGLASADAIVSQRLKNGPFRDIVDFHRRCGRDFDTSILMKIAEVGAFDELGDTNRRRVAAKLKHLNKNAKSATLHSEATLFGDDAPILFGREIESLADYDPSSRPEKEREAVGFYFGGHPLDRFEPAMRELGARRISSVAQYYAEHMENIEQLFGIKVFGVITEVYSDLDFQHNRRLSLKVSDKLGVQRLTANRRMFMNPPEGMDEHDYFEYIKDDLQTLAKNKQPVLLLADFNGRNGNVYIKLSDYQPIEIAMKDTPDVENIVIEFDPLCERMIGHVSDTERGLLNDAIPRIDGTDETGREPLSEADRRHLSEYVSEILTRFAGHEIKETIASFENCRCSADEIGAVNLIIALKPNRFSQSQHTTVMSDNTIFYRRDRLEALISTLGGVFDFRIRRGNGPRIIYPNSVTIALHDDVFKEKPQEAA